MRPAYAWFVLAATMAFTPLSSQSPAPRSVVPTVDSARLLLTHADSLLGNTAGVAPVGPALSMARRALEAFSQSNDSSSIAGAHNVIAWGHYRLRRYDSTTANAQLAMRWTTPRDSVLIAWAHQNLSLALLARGASFDSAMTFHATQMRWRRAIGDLHALQSAWADAAEAIEVRREVASIASNPAVVSALTDSVIAFYHASAKAGLAGGEPVSVAGVYGRIGNEWLRRGRADSSLAYRRRAFEISGKQGNLMQMFFDINSIAGAFGTPLRDRTMRSIRNPDSAVVWAHRALNLAAQRDSARLPTQLMRLSVIFNQIGKLDSARVYNQLAYDMARRQGNAAGTREALLDRFNLFTQQGFPDSVVTLRREMLQFEATQSRGGSVASRRTALVSWIALANAHSAAGASDSAQYWIRRVMDTVMADSALAPTAMNAWYAMGMAYSREQKPDSAVAAFRRAEAYAPTLPTPALANSFRHSVYLATGRAFLQRGDIDSAVTQFRRSLSLPDVSMHGSAWGAIADAHMERGQFDSALVYHQRALRVHAGSVNVRVMELDVLMGIGTTFRALGLRDSALVYFHRAMTIGAEDNQRPSVMGALERIAGTYFDGDVLDSSFVYTRAALAIANSMGARQREAALLNNVGLSFMSTGQRDSARVLFERSLQLHRAVRNRDGEAATLSNIAYLRSLTAVDDSVFALLRASLARYEQTQDKLGAVVPRLNLSKALASRERLDSAMGEARVALATAESVNHAAYTGRALASIARVFAQRQQVDSAQLYYEQAAAAMRRVGFTRGLRELLAERADLFRRDGSAGSLARATAYFDSASAVVDNARRAAGGDDNEVALSETQVDLFGGWARAWAGRTKEVGTVRSAAAALAAVERGRAQSLVEMVTRLESPTRAALAPTIARSQAGSDLVSEADSLLATLRATRSAALSYLLAGDTLFTWLLTPEGTLQLQQPVALREEELNRLVRSARRSFDADDARSVQLAPDDLAAASDSSVTDRDAKEDWERLAELLLPSDLLDRVPARTPIVIIPHGSIGLVPFSALATGPVAAPRAPNVRTGRSSNADTVSVTLGTRYALRFAPSFAALRASEKRARTVVARASAVRTEPLPAAPARVWGATRAPGAAPRPSPRPSRSAAPVVVASALVVGNPSMPYVYSGRWTNRAQLQPLPGAEAESRTIASRLGAVAITGRAATETAIRARMKNAPLIHFATHGLAYGTSSAARRSFVAFAPDATNDGLLTLGELMDDRALTLSAELVVLSACQTGLGDMKKAEGSIGLQRAFLAKGARSVLVSLWNVDDTATRLLMEKFYAYWLDPTTVRTKARALQMAQEAVRRTPGYAAPKYWAAFQLVGAE